MAITVAALVVACLAAGGLAASGAFGAAPVAEQNFAGPSATASGRSAGTLAYIQVPSFHDQQYATVGDWLRGHGLTARVDWDDHTGLPTGTVVSVSPGGQVAAGSTGHRDHRVELGRAAAHGPRPIGPGTTPGEGASPVSSSAAGAGSGSAQLGAGTAPGAGTASPPAAAGTTTTAPPATTPAPTPRSHAGAPPTPSPTCAFPLGPVCF